MARRFEMFVVFAEMRTGSNFLEANLNAIDGLECLGEAFNPHFIGYPNVDDVLGMTVRDREEAPRRLLARFRSPDGPLRGFRYFHDHDPRVLPDIIADQACAKIVLTRNPLDSYVSWKIAKATGQWKLTNVRRRKESRIVFDGDEYLDHVERLQAFQIDLLNALQISGQTAFFVAFEDLQNVDVMNGLASWLGVDGRLEGLKRKLKRQNPEHVTDKVENVDEMRQALARLDAFNLSRTPNFEPRRGPNVPGFVTGARAPLMFLPIRGGPVAQVTRWMGAVDGVGAGALRTNHSQASLRDWMAAHPGHRSFAVLRHPLARAYAAFCDRILYDRPEAFGQIRKVLVRQHDVPMPEEGAGPDMDAAACRAAFVGFLKFLKANLNGQTGVRIDPHWASQAAVLQGMAGFCVPDMLIREDDMATALPELAMKAGAGPKPSPELEETARPVALSSIYDAGLEELARDAYARDFIRFGFGRLG